ncbi:hypothetical protein [Pseudoalteromonas sp. DL2-H2.2]|uniref:hypothetical protein n=1 Tax=Pseudoalteromonas sp. DL2-H2.2 TaxID=2908889 RepID=UPI003FA748A8
MRVELRTRHYSLKAEKSYLYWIKGYILFNDKKRNFAWNFAGHSPSSNLRVGVLQKTFAKTLTIRVLSKSSAA